MVFFVTGYGHGNVYSYKHRENERLNEAREYGEQHHRELDRQQPVARKTLQHARRDHQEYQDNQVLAEDVAEKTDGERKRPGELSYDMEGEHQGSHPERLTQEVLHVVDDAVARDRDVLDENKSEQGQRNRSAGLRGGADEAGDESEQVKRQDEDEERADYRRQRPGLALADDIPHEPLQRDYAKLHESLESARVAKPKPAAHNDDGCAEYEDNQPRDHHVLGHPFGHNMLRYEEMQPGFRFFQRIPPLLLIRPLDDHRSHRLENNNGLCQPKPRRKSYKICNATPA